MEPVTPFSHFVSQGSSILKVSKGRALLWGFGEVGGLSVEKQRSVGKSHIYYPYNGHCRTIWNIPSNPCSCMYWSYQKLTRDRNGDRKSLFGCIWPSKTFGDADLCKLNVTALNGTEGGDD